MRAGRLPQSQARRSLSRAPCPPTAARPIPGRPRRDGAVILPHARSENARPDAENAYLYATQGDSRRARASTAQWRARARRLLGQVPPTRTARRASDASPAFPGCCRADSGACAGEGRWRYRCGAHDVFSLMRRSWMRTCREGRTPLLGSYRTRLLAMSIGRVRVGGFASAYATVDEGEGLGTCSV
ncbi:hypothetical protein FKP32DRAFT_1283251 [Trametes sanguinea]|nr:hypothetical protein FKP32DRAFT_1283251 [Trametes sanguinea]